jgi:hypothetical protein
VVVTFAPLVATAAAFDLLDQTHVLNIRIDE